jgi:predicted Zn-ribbon and HTH transcriptional regulator
MKDIVIIEGLRKETFLYKDAISEAIKKLGESHPVASKLGRVLKLAKYQPIPCKRCGRTLRNPKAIQRGMGPRCYEIHIEESQSDISFKKETV